MIRRIYVTACHVRTEQEAQKEQTYEQMSLFDFVGEEDKKDYEVHYPNVEEFPKEVLLGFEKEVLGIYLSGHPLEDYLGKMKKNVTANAADFVREEESGAIPLPNE